MSARAVASTPSSPSISSPSRGCTTSHRSSGAPTPQRLDLTPQSAGLLAISLGLRSSFADDHEVLRHGFVLYDALYRWCRELKGETHSWPPKMTT